MPVLLHAGGVLGLFASKISLKFVGLFQYLVYLVGHVIYDTYVTKPKRTVSTASGRFVYFGPVYIEVGAGGGGGNPPVHIICHFNLITFT